MKHQARTHAFTLVEMLVASAILAIILIALGQMASNGASILRSTSRKADQFREARAALDSIQVTLSQATLNTYWDYVRTSSTAAPTGYLRQSELRYISGTVSDLGLDSTKYFGHGVFFQAPLGYVSNTAGTSYGSLHSLLNTCGYCVAFNNDSALLPSYLSGKVPTRSRYRLMELREPADTLTLYNFSAGVNGSGQPNVTTYQGRQWFQTPFAAVASSQVLAENVVAMVVLPQLSVADQQAHKDNGNTAFTARSLAPTYFYDSSTTGQKTTNTYLDSSNQLPPVIQVTLVAIDENSAKLLASRPGTGAPLLAVNSAGNPLFTDAKNYQDDLDQLQATLTGSPYKTFTPAVAGLPRMSYRIFTTKFNLLASKWSTSSQ